MDQRHPINETTTTSATTTTAAPEPAPEPPPFRCPGCRTENPRITYGQMSWNTQDFDIEEDYWDSSEYGEGDMLIDARCKECEELLTQALLRYNAKYPDNSLPTDFQHDVWIPVGLPVPRNRSTRKNPILALSDDVLRQMIEDAKRHLGALLDENDERCRIRERQARGGAR